MVTPFAQEVTKKFLVTSDLPDLNAILTLTRRADNKAFQYGNGTGVLITSLFDDGREPVRWFVDTRHDPSVADFDEWCYYWMVNMFDGLGDTVWKDVSFL